MKKLKYILFFCMLLTTINAYALKSDDKELTERNVCEHFELALANSDDTITSVSCHESYDDAKSAMNTNEEKDLIILERSNNKTKIIDAKYALVYLDRGDVVTYLYTNNSFKTSLTYMNNSGNAVGEFVRYYNIDMKDILIIQDDLDEEIGLYKLKINSSSGGHNGIKSIISSLGTQSFPRLKVGIGSVKKDEVIDYVLGKFSKKEMEILNNELSTFRKIIESFVNVGIDKTMNVYNTK